MILRFKAVNLATDSLIILTLPETAGEVNFIRLYAKYSIITFERPRPGDSGTALPKPFHSSPTKSTFDRLPVI